MNEDFSQIVNKILSMPEFGSMVNELKSSTAATEETGKKEISSEEITKKLPEIMEKLGLRSSSEESVKGSRPNETEKSVSLSSADSEKIEKAVKTLKKMDNQKCEKLLGALKPYLSRERGEVIDKAMSVMKITDILGAVQEINPEGNRK